ncbi:hypothetical protein IEO21_04905 [Rhodonia placenta]|uniref:Uncharacterized protein n=1 Tax=Rhodonia placenta TaxID=104341 RepID=A0A8H7P2Y6_9APHY|nr:hypothetical protein IEO21_04905 [Postia placenta]
MVTCYAQGTPYTVHTPAAATSYHRVPSTTGFSTGDLSCSGSPESLSSFLSLSPPDSSSSYSSCSPSSSYTSPYTPNSSNVGRELPARRSSVQKKTRKTPYSRDPPNSRRRTSRSSSSSPSRAVLLHCGVTLRRMTAHCPRKSGCAVACRRRCRGCIRWRSLFGEYCTKVCGWWEDVMGCSVGRMRYVGTSRSTRKGVLVMLYLVIFQDGLTSRSMFRVDVKWGLDSVTCLLLLAPLCITSCTIG